jgi:hypothetical protein
VLREVIGDANTAHDPSQPSDQAYGSIRQTASIVRFTSFAGTLDRRRRAACYRFASACSRKRASCSRSSGVSPSPKSSASKTGADLDGRLTAGYGVSGRA